MYKEFLEFSQKNKNTTAKKIRAQKVEWYGDGIVTEDEIQHRLFCDFVIENKKQDYNISNCILLDFPLGYVSKVISKFVEDSYAYAWGVDDEIAKLIYHLWPKYMGDIPSTAPQNTAPRWREYIRTFPYSSIFNSLYTIKENLAEFKNTDFIDSLLKLIEMKKVEGRYCGWHLFAFLPLIGDKNHEILMNVIKFRYDDAQNMLMFGLAQYDPRTFLDTFQNILEFWHEKHVNPEESSIGSGRIAYIGFEHGTGMMGELSMIIKKYKEIDGVDVYESEAIKNILEYHEVE